MSKLATTDPNELRPLLHERIDQCSPEELDAVQKLLLELRMIFIGALSVPFTARDCQANARRGCDAPVAGSQAKPPRLPIS